MSSPECVPMSIAGRVRLVLMGKGVLVILQGVPFGGWRLVLIGVQLTVQKENRMTAEVVELEHGPNQTVEA